MSWSNIYHLKLTLFALAFNVIFPAIEATCFIIQSILFMIILHPCRSSADPIRSKYKEAARLVHDDLPEEIVVERVVAA